MKIHLTVEYRTQWGESVGVRLTYTTRTGRQTSASLMLETTDGIRWGGQTTACESATSVDYTYYILREGKLRREEWKLAPHHITLSGHDVETRDRWRDREAPPPPKGGRANEDRKSALPPLGGGGAVLIVSANVPEGHTLVVLGSHPTLGAWQIKNAIHLRETSPCLWSWSPSPAAGGSEYKYFCIKADTGELAAWESRGNRALPRLDISEGTQLRLEDEPVHLPFKPWRGAGCVIPVFSLRSEESFGVGDFGDLRRMVAWVAHTGQRVLQILPINDTTITHTWKDSYPYNAISIYALHPMYVSLADLPALHDAAQHTAYEAMREKLNALPQVDYEQVMAAKMGYLRRLFEQEGPATMKSREYKQFTKRNAHWLTPYTAFCCLRDLYGTADFRLWPALSTYDEAEVERLATEDNEMAFYAYIQYLLDVQLTAAHDAARDLGVVLKGDIPIGISPQSVEAWVEPYYFNLDRQAGAPPDAFSQNGQNWGFPTYNWERMREDGYQWWKRRFTKMAEHFDAYRIDHVLGFFRIWEIPLDSVHGLLGQFAPALPMSVEEIESYGLTWHDNYTVPYIADWIIERHFPDNADDVKHAYLEEDGYGQYRMKPEYDTQRKVEASDAPQDVKEGLYALISNVLFIADSHDATRYHPRIAAQNDYFYKTLSQADKDAFNRLYNHYYYERHNQYWYAEAMQKLPALTEATRMLPCAEDLGMVPECVPWVMNELKILTLEIQTMPKNPARTFANLQDNPYRSVATLFTHDMPTLRLWWEEDWPRTQRYFNESLHHIGPAPHPMPPSLCEEVVANHLASPSMLCLISLQDWLSIDARLRLPDPEPERINIPANPRHYWRYRMHLTIEQLLAEDDFNDKVRALIQHNRN